ncbi:hypothetical protein EDB85DRAFT_2039586 [Lactarius pseudohatsudake]|nr:hypothetical protein EDB85DRAFT_2039586 [Lactarius pseudohatsudake]
MIFSFLTLASLLPSVIAQSSSSFDISAQCQSSLVSIASSAEGQCLNSAGIAPIFFAGSNTSLTRSFSILDPCTNQTLATLVANITQGCSSDLVITGSSVQEYYPCRAPDSVFKRIVHGVDVLPSNNANQLCLIEELYDVRIYIFSLFPQLIAEGLPALGLSQNAITSDENSTLSKQCGSDFLDGKTPASISQTAAGSDLSNTNGDSNIALRPLRLRGAPTSLIGLAIFLAALL